MDSPRVCTMKRAIWTYIFLSLIVACCSREISVSDSRHEDSSSSVLSDLQQESTEKSDMDIVAWHAKFDDGLELYSTRSTNEPETCQKYYGYLPCSDTWIGGLFLFLVYGFILYKAVEWLSEGTKLFESEVESGCVEGVLLPFLKTLPASFLILVSVVATSKEEAKAQAEVSIGLLAGTNVMLLGLVWGFSIIQGRGDLRALNYQSRKKSLTKGFSLTETGVKSGWSARKLSWIMPFTVLPYLIAQFPITFGWSPSSINIAVIAAFLLSLVGLLSYWILQCVRTPGIAETSPDAEATVRLNGSTPKKSTDAPFDEDRVLSRAELEQVFSRLDVNRNESISKGELRGLILAMGLGKEPRLPTKDDVDFWMDKFDTQNQNGKKDGVLSREEFVDGMQRWMSGMNKEPEGSFQPRFWKTNNQEINLRIGALRREYLEEGRVIKDPMSMGMSVAYAVLYLIAGIAIAALASIPVVGVTINLSKAIGISPLFVSIVATPLLLHLGDGLSYISSAREMRGWHITTVFERIYRELTMNNTMALAIFIGVAYYKSLTWNFLPEVLVILIAYLVIGIVASVRESFPLWMGLVAVLLYPVSIAFVVILTLFAPNV